MKRPVPRVGRILDGVGILLFLAGAGLYARAWWGLRRLESSPEPSTEDSGAFATVARVEDLHELSDKGLLLMAVGFVVAVVAAAVARWKGGGEDRT